MFFLLKWFCEKTLPCKAGFFYYVCRMKYVELAQIKKEIESDFLPWGADLDYQYFVYCFYYHNSKSDAKGAMLSVIRSMESPICPMEMKNFPILQTQFLPYFL